jgi:dienelactone hydrolase
VIVCPGYLGWVQDVARQWTDRLLRQAEEADRVGRARRCGLTTPAAVTAHQRWLRERFAALVPELPPGGEMRALGELRHGPYTISKLLIETFPGRWTPAAVWRHEAQETPAPGVLFCAGHYLSAWRDPEYQAVCMDLARHGLVVLAFDPPGQGEMTEYVEIPEGCVSEHMHVGVQCMLTGGYLARYFVGHTRRALDALCAQPQVQADRIGITGFSGGGTQTLQMMLADERLAAAAPGGYVHDLRTYMETGQTHDHEQIYVGLQGEGFNHADFLAGFAPRPCRVLAAAYDFFPIEATLETVEQARAAYRALGAEERLDVAIGRHEHRYSPELREAAVRFFTRWLGGEERWRGELADPALDERDLAAWSPQAPGKTVFQLNGEYLQRHRARPAGEAGELVELVQRVLGIETAALAAPIRPRPFIEGEWEGHPGTGWWFWSEPGICMAAVHYRPRAECGTAAPGCGPAACGTGAPGCAAPQTWLAVLPQGSDDCGRYRDDLLGLLAAGDEVVLIDVRGVGAVRSFPQTAVDGHGSRDNEYFAASSAFALGGSSVGARVFDVLRGCRFALQELQPARELCMIGCGLGALHAYLAAAVEPRVRRVVCRDMIPSWRAVVETRLYDYTNIADRHVVPGVLRHFDLPDLAPCFAGRELVIERPARVEVSAEEYARAKAAGFDDGRGHRWELKLPG